MRRRVVFLLALGLVISAGCGWSTPASSKAPTATGIVVAKDSGWPQWRGPRRDGVSTEKGLLQTWPKEGPPLAWQIKGLGAGYASISVAEGRIFVMGQPANECVLFALDAKDGATLWMKPVGKKWGDGPRCTPTVDGDRVYVIGPSGELVCFEVKAGAEVWRANFINDFGGALPIWGYCESPLIDGDRLICTPGGKQATLAALDKATGKVVWQTVVPDIGGGGGDDRGGYSSVVVSNAAGVKQYVQLTGRGCVGLKADDGKFLWGYSRIANGTANVPTPIVEGDFVFCSSGYGQGSALLELSPADGSVKVREVYFKQGSDLQNHHGGMVKLGDHIYLGHGHNQGFPACIEMKTGKITWLKERGPGSGSASIVCADGQIYFRYDNGVMALIEATPKEYRLNGSFKTPNPQTPCWAHPVVQDGKLYLRDGDALLVYNVSAK